MSLAAGVLDRARGYAKAKQWRRTIVASRLAAALDPKHADAWYLLGLGLRYRQWWSAAALAFLRGAAVDDDLASALRRGGADPAVRESGDGRRLEALLADRPELGDKPAILALITTSAAGDAFPIGWWLALYARLVHLGWPAHAYAAKRRAARLAIARATAPGGAHSPGQILELAQALLYDQRPDEVRKAIRRADLTSLDTAAARQVQRIGAYLSLVAGKPAARSLRPRKGSTGEGDRQFADLVAGKSIAVVGPADTRQENGTEIDSFDLVVRMNVLGSGPVKRPEQFGSRTAISYYNSTTEDRQHALIQSVLAERAVEFAVMRLTPTPERAAAYRKHVPVRTMMPVVRFFGGSAPLAVPRILWDLLHFAPARIKVFNVDFYTGESRYAEAYRSFDFNLATGLAYHDLVQSYDFTRSLFAAGLFEADAVLATVLGWGVDEYLRRIDLAFAAAPPR